MAPRVRDPTVTPSSWRRVDGVEVTIVHGGEPGARKTTKTHRWRFPTRRAARFVIAERRFVVAITSGAQKHFVPAGGGPPENC